MWRLIGALATRRLIRDFQVGVDRALDQIRQVSAGLVVAQAGLMLAIFGVGFALVGLFFHWSGQSEYVKPALMTGAVALLPGAVCLAIARSLFGRR